MVLHEDFGGLVHRKEGGDILHADFTFADQRVKLWGNNLVPQGGIDECLLRDGVDLAVSGIEDVFHR